LGIIKILIKWRQEVKQLKPKIQKPTVRYRRYAEKIIENYYKKHSGICIACGSPLWSYTAKRKLCIECAVLKNRIYKRVVFQNSKDPRFKNINACIEISDRKFVTELCDGNCFECIFQDCILPEES
jgi:hypothetical protein